MINSNAAPTGIIAEYIVCDVTVVAVVISSCADVWSIEVGSVVVVLLDFLTFILCVVVVVGVVVVVSKKTK